MYERPPAMKPRVPSAGQAPGGPSVGGGIPPGTGGIRPPMPPTGPPPGGPSPGPIPFQTGAPPAFTGALGGGRPPVRMGTIGSMNDMTPRLGGGGPAFGGGPVQADPRGGPRGGYGTSGGPTGPGGNPTILPTMGPRGGGAGGFGLPPGTIPEGGPTGSPTLPGLAPGLPPGAYPTLGGMPKPGGGNLPGQQGNPYDTSMPDDWRRRAQRSTL